MKYQNIKIGCLCLSALLLGACSDQMEETGSRYTVSDVMFTGLTDIFSQTISRSEDQYIGKDGNGSKYGTFYIRQIPKEEQNTHFWGHYKVAEGMAGELVPVSIDETYHLRWKGVNTEYYFQALSAPVVEEGGTGGVTFEHEDNPGGDKYNGSGKVVFGDHKTGLEYFVGATIGPEKLFNGQSVLMLLKRQVSKVVFFYIWHQEASGARKKVETCEIIFPNLYSSATFDMAHFRCKKEPYDPNEPYQSTMPSGKEMNNYITLDYTGQSKGVRLDYKRMPPGATDNSTYYDIYQALYVHPFKFWDAKENKPENQSGFFIVNYDGKSYTGNIYGTDNVAEVFASEKVIVESMYLIDGNGTGDGTGSIIIDWNVDGEQDVPHYPNHGIYTKEEATELLAALQSGGEIPARFFSEEGGKKVIRLYANIDWSTVTEKLTIPDGYVLDGQGYNIKMGEGGSIAGEIEAPLYINGTLHSS